MRETGLRRPRCWDKTVSKKKLRSPEKGDANQPATPYTDLTTEKIVQLVLCDYNKKHGTDLEYVRSLRENYFIGHGYILNFVPVTRLWVHVNFLARRHSEPRGKLLLFAEAYRDVEDVSNPLSPDIFTLTTLSPVKRTDHGYGCLQCMSSIKHPCYGYHAGFDPLMSSKTLLLSQGEAETLSEFALQDYNDKNGTNMKFERALKCMKFSCAGLLMDFNARNTSWVHLNFEARRPEFDGVKEEVILLFVELYKGDGDKHVLASLSIVKPTDKHMAKSECAYCPDDILHPLSGFRCASNKTCTP